MCKTAKKQGYPALIFFNGLLYAASVLPRCTVSLPGRETDIPIIEQEI